MTDAELALAALRRAVDEHGRRAPGSPLKIGSSAPDRDGFGMVIQLLVLRPCRCGAHVAQATFRGASLEAAAREARLFVEAITPGERDEGE